MTEEVVIDNVTAPGGGRIGMVHCPGTGGIGLPFGDQDRLLDSDLTTCCHWGAQGLVTLMEPAEIRALGLDRLGERVTAAGLRWWHLPMVDGAAPEANFESLWHDAGPALHAILDEPGRLVLHCRAGLGRSGTVAARLLIERGFEAEQAVIAVRRARPGAIENASQLMWLRQYAAR